MIPELFNGPQFQRKFYSEIPVELKIDDVRSGVNLYFSEIDG